VIDRTGPPIFCSPVEYRHMAQAQQAKLWLIGRAPSRNRKLFVPRSLTGCSFASLSPCDRVPRRDRSVRSQRPGLSHLLPRPEITAPRLFACGSPMAQRPGCSIAVGPPPRFRLRRKFCPNIPTLTEVLACGLKFSQENS
jgi:hypothetical protein